MEAVEIELRREAARRRLAGESPELIAQDLGRTRQWVAKWAARYDPADPGWAAGRSRAPARVANRTAGEIETGVLAVRARLEENPWAQVGAPAIAWELNKLGAVVPPLRTIERILARAGVTERPRAASCRASLAQSSGQLDPSAMRASAARRTSSGSVSATSSSAADRRSSSGSMVSPHPAAGERC